MSQQPANSQNPLSASQLKPNSSVLDATCGPGTLALRLAHRAGQVHGIDFSESMIAVFRNQIEPAGHRNIALHCGDAQTLPYADATFDAAFSLFGLMFFPDRQQGFAEIHRTLKPGGSIAVTSWAPVDQSPAMQTMFGALRAIKPDLPPPQRSIGTLENPERFKQEMEEAGFRNIEIRNVVDLINQIRCPHIAYQAKASLYDYNLDLSHTENLPKFASVFVTAAIHKSSHTGKFDYGRNFYAKDADELNIHLPIKNHEPDYPLMETLISAIQKLVIKDVVLYADRKITATQSGIAS